MASVAKSRLAAAGRLLVLVGVVYALEWIRSIVNVWCGIRT